jgi:hypothetical protein
MEFTRNLTQGGKKEPPRKAAPASNYDKKPIAWRALPNARQPLVTVSTASA